MPTAEQINDMTTRAARRAVIALGSDYEPLGRIQRIQIAFAAVARAGKTLDNALPLIEQEAILMRAAQTALAQARAEGGEALYAKWPAVLLDQMSVQATRRAVLVLHRECVLAPLKAKTASP